MDIIAMVSIAELQVPVSIQSGPVHKIRPQPLTGLRPVNRPIFPSRLLFGDQLDATILRATLGGAVGGDETGLAVAVHP